MNWSQPKAFARVVLLGLLAMVFTTPSLLYAEDAIVEEIVVTGSRISRPNLTQPTPVTTIGSADLQLSGTADLGSLLAELPALGSTATMVGNSNSFSDLAGLNLPDLRRLGEARTLTLVDGKRHVGGSPGTTAVDLNSIPKALIDRVEVITGGASAVYGSDAVSGVINVILKDDFEGFEIDANGGAAGSDYGQNHSISMTFGRNFGEERGNFTLSFANDRLGDIQANDLDYNNNYGTIINPDDTGENDGIPDRLIVRNVISERIDENSVLFPFGGPPSAFGNADGLIVFDDNGAPQPQTLRDQSNSFAFGSFPNGCDFCFFLEDYVTITPDVSRDSFNGTLRYEFSEAAEVYLDAKYLETDIQEELQPSFNFGSININVADNPYLDEALRADLLGNGITGANLARFHADAGSRRNLIERETERVVVGMQGLIETGIGAIDYDVFYNYGKVSNTVVGLNRRIPANLTAAVDAIADPVSGEIVCRDPSAAVLGECVPFNPFGRRNSQAAVDFSFIRTEEKQELEQESAGLALVSDTSSWFELSAGAIGWAAGLEWRREESATDGDPIVQADLTESAAQPDEVGGYEVFEGFAEITVPLLADVPFFHELTVDGAIRFADYTHSGHAEAWKTGIIWAPFDQLRLRATYSEAVRAPNISEAFRPATPGFSDVDDPCDADVIDDDPDRAGNCAALGLPPGFQANDNVSVDSESSGNRDLEAEDSESYTYGFVYEPSWIDGLALTVDYYDIEIADAITLVDAQDIVDNCVDATGGPDANFCSLFTRDAVTQDIDFVRSTFVNASKLTTEGVDVAITYNKSLADWTDGGGMSWLSGNFAFNFVGTYLKELDEFIFQDRPDELNIERGEVGDPIRSFRATASYNHGNVTVGWTGRYIGEVKRYARGDDIAEDISPSSADSVMYHNINLQYLLELDRATIEFYGGVNNLTEEDPPRGIYGTQTEANQAIYDAVGRYWFVGVRGRI
ncbi:MAG: TonB-dependent receptor domain-containing protein [Pseudomonadales bacterium]